LCLPLLTAFFANIARSADNGQCVTVPSATIDTIPTKDICSTTDSLQVFRFVPQVDGFFQVQPADNWTLCFELPSASLEDGWYIRLATCVSPPVDYQLWLQVVITDSSEVVYPALQVR
jgi:hypothetical protein